ncbi:MULTISPECIES: LysR family transcriptional regulator [Paenibacillus]|uniref:Transcriptional regulator n=3 Tax=Paenibacillus TaxID=44249 RepID=A0ABX2ZBY4_PAEPO|nr:MULTISPECIES: LysR family transcriptional regulator [Paenibacillus]MBP1175539.1 DNA-binding transcriptional LysR family regulator [Paenibacillus sp. PvR133]MDR6778028.1 DNA-binding transcriptional LysR family regulator [Paenibacillus peoriae]MXO78442.1 LysR family transcriptional regulator [Paenibacillus sp. OT2-17]ODA08922.1 transcriptional regulator [Paenibacillus polymyxa]OME75381.1 LysR family transcriptional regulator [Paenibacillus peoriae]
MNLHALRLFHVVASTGSVTRASELLNISQPAITAQIKKFEKEISLTLLMPLGRGIALTDAGEKLAVLARRLFAVEQQIEQFSQDYRDGAHGHIRLAATYLPAHFLIPAWIAKFKQQYEHVEMTINTTNSNDALQQLLNIEVDLAIYGGLPEQYPDTIQTEELFRDELWFVVAPDHRYANQQVSLLEMMHEPFVMREKGSSTRERLFSLCRTYNAPTPQVTLNFTGLHEAITAVIAGYGANFVSSLVVREYVERGELCRVYVEDIQLLNSIAICTRKNEPLSTATLNLIQLIRNHS